MWWWALVVGASAGELWSTDSETDSAGNVFVVGRFAGVFRIGEHTIESSGSTDAFVMKLDPTGKALWLRRIGGPLEDAGESLELLPGGQLQITGSFQGTVTLGDRPVTALGGRDLFVARIDAEGRLTSSRTYGSPGGGPVATVVPKDNERGSLRIVMRGGGWANVYLNGEKLSSTAPLALPLPAGEYEVRLENAYSGLDQRQLVQVDTGGTTVIQATLEVP
jgi:hypothetical protein